MTQLLIDGDILIYSACFACQREHLWEDGLATYSSDLEDCQFKVDQRVESLLTDLDAMDEEPIICLSSRPNFREELYPDYKQNRAGTIKPLNFKALEAYIVKQYTTARWNGLEADDVMGILQTPNTIIVSDDKDMLQIPGKVCHGGELKTVTPESGHQWFLKQVLTGDPTDNYKGCPGIGDKNKVFKENPVLTWRIVVNTYKKAGLTEDDAILQAHLARILTADLWDAEINQRIPWRPN